MRAVIQRVTGAAVSINGGAAKKTGKGIVILVAVGKDDRDADAAWLADKIVSLRIFPNDDGKMDRSALDINGELLVVSQFTLYGDCAHGRRPDFSKAAPPAEARALYESFVRHIMKYGLATVTGEFAADMLVEIRNDGPVTISIDTQKDHDAC